MDFMRRIFRVMTATPAPRDAGEQAPRFTTYGHDDSYCAAIRRDRIIAENTSLSEWLAENEYFDGELVYSDPWPCEQCVTLEKLQQEEARFKPQAVPQQAPAPETTVQTRINIDTGEEQAGWTSDPAVAFLRTLSPDEPFPFLKAMKAKLDDNPSWTPTEKQASAILRCAKRGSKKGGTRPARSGTPGTDSPTRTQAALSAPTHPDDPSPAAPSDEPQVRKPDAAATEKQVDWLVKLASQKTPEFFARAGEAEVRARAEKLTRGQASEKISELMKMPSAGKATA